MWRRQVAAARRRLFKGALAADGRRSEGRRRRVRAREKRLGPRLPGVRIDVPDRRPNTATSTPVTLTRARDYHEPMPDTHTTAFLDELRDESEKLKARLTDLVGARLQGGTPSLGYEAYLASFIADISRLIVQIEKDHAQGPNGQRRPGDVIGAAIKGVPGDVGGDHRSSVVHGRHREPDRADGPGEARSLQEGGVNRKWQHSGS